MPTKSPVRDSSSSDHSNGNENLTKQLTPSEPRTIPITSSTPRQSDPPLSSDTVLTHLPSYSRWFSWNHIHECEVRFLPEFFDFRLPSKTPKSYMYLRNSIVKYFRTNPSGKITFTDVRKTLVGDVGSIRRVFDFLETWGLINYSPWAPNKPLKWDDKETKSASQTDESAAASADSSAPSATREAAKRVCSGCKSVCSIACFACDKYDLTLCARCYVRGNYRVGVSSSDFRRVEINEEMRTDWTDKETLHLLEAVMHYGDDWRKIAQHVGGRSEKECVAHFVKLPFRDQFSGYPETVDIGNKDNMDYGHGDNELTPSKQIRLTPLADASNPIMAQAAFLSAVAGVKVAEVAAHAAVSKLSEVDYNSSRQCVVSAAANTENKGVDDGSIRDMTPIAVELAFVDANLQVNEEEEMDVERAISVITEVQMKEMQEKLEHFEEVDLKMEKEWQQLEQMKSMLFVDRLLM